MLIVDAVAVFYFIWAFGECGLIYDIMDNLTGHRFTASHSRIGCVANDITPETMGMIREFMDTFPQELKDFHMLLDRNRLFTDRNENVGYLDPEDAIDIGARGPVLRACGYAVDVIKHTPYPRYQDVEFEIHTRLAGDNVA